MKHKKIVIAGGTGFIGQAMAQYFGKDNRVVILGRHPAKRNDNVTYWRWDGLHVEKHWALELEGADLIINLAGKSVNCRYNENNKKEIIDSRVNATQTIGEAVRRCTVPPKLWINAASATIYRHTTDKANDEYTGVISEWKKDNMADSNSQDKDFSVEVCRAWEDSFFNERTPFTRKIALRAAITLGTGGVMEPYFNLLKFGLGGHQGNGRQMYSWVHVEDLCRIVAWCYENKELEGVFNCAAPNAVTNAEFMKTLRAVTSCKIGLPAYTWMIKTGAALIGTEPELLLKSRWVYPAKLLDSGFRFTFNFLEEALTNVVKQVPGKRYKLFSSFKCY